MMKATNPKSNIRRNYILFFSLHRRIIVIFYPETSEKNPQFNFFGSKSQFRT